MQVWPLFRHAIPMLSKVTSKATSNFPSRMFDMTCVEMREWEIKRKGNGKKINEMWSQKIVTKVFINLQFRLGR